MALSFNKQTGGAQKSSIDSFQYVDGDNKMRVVGDILARYVYWIKGENDKNIPLECLSFDRDQEAFTNKEKDWVREYYPDLKCGWSYATQCIGPKDGKVKVVSGESYIELVRFSKAGTEIESVISYGSSDHPTSPHYGDQMEMYAEFKTKRMSLNKDEVYATAKRVYHPR